MGQASSVFGPGMEAHELRLAIQHQLHLVPLPGRSRFLRVGSSRSFQNYQNAFDPNANYSNSNFDIRNMFKGQIILRALVRQGTSVPKQ